MHYRRNQNGPAVLGTAIGAVLTSGALFVFARWAFWPSLVLAVVAWATIKLISTGR